MHGEYCYLKVRPRDGPGGQLMYGAVSDILMQI